MIAEGVENATQLAMLTDFGCDEAQGYHYSRPLPPTEFEVWLRGFGRRREGVVPAPIDDGCAALVRRAS